MNNGTVFDIYSHCPSDACCSEIIFLAGESRKLSISKEMAWKLFSPVTKGLFSRVTIWLSITIPAVFGGLFFTRVGPLLGSLLWYIPLLTSDSSEARAYLDLIWNLSPNVSDLVVKLFGDSIITNSGYMVGHRYIDSGRVVEWSSG